VINEMDDAGSVILDLEPATALLLRRVMQAGMRALRDDISADQREQLTGLSMFLGDAAEFDSPHCQSGRSRLVA
jgi:hypothetical protein